MNSCVPTLSVPLKCVRSLSLIRTCVLQRYVEEQVQRTGVALETQGISFITTGKKRDSLTVRISLVTPPHTPLLYMYVGSFSSDVL